MFDKRFKKNIPREMTFLGILKYEEIKILNFHLCSYVGILEISGNIIF